MMLSPNINQNHEIFLKSPKTQFGYTFMILVVSFRTFENLCDSVGYDATLFLHYGLGRCEVPSLVCIPFFQCT